MHPEEAALVQKLSDELYRAIPQDARVVCPLTLGGHVDHVLTRKAVEKMDQPSWYYADYPYITKDAESFIQLKQSGWESQVFPVSQPGLSAWMEAVETHASQISTFWPDLDSMRSDIQAHYRQDRGIRLWRHAKKL